MRFEKHAVRLFHDVAGVAGLMRKNPTQDLRTLVYHDIPSESIEKFSEQLQQISKTWKFVNASVMKLMIERSIPISDRYVHLTFDDGYGSNYSVGKLLSSLGIQSTFFIIPEFVAATEQGNAGAFVANRLFTGQKIESDQTKLFAMSWENILNLSAMGHEIGSHTMSHPRLSELSDFELRNEFLSSKTVISDQLGIVPTQLALTFGDIGSFSKRVVTIAREFYSIIHTSVRGSNKTFSQQNLVLRETVHPWDSVNFVTSVLAGTLDFQYGPARKEILSWESEDKC